MACTSQTLSGLARDCASSMGGILEVLIANFTDVTGVTLTGDKITTITMATSAKFKRYQFARNTGSLTSTGTIDKTNGTSFVTSDLVMQFNRMETTKRVEISALSVNDLVCIVKDANGSYWYLGYNEPVTASAKNGQTGTQRSDSNNYNITLEDISAEMPYEVDGSIVAGLL